MSAPVSREHSYVSKKGLAWLGIAVPLGFVIASAERDIGFTNATWLHWAIVASPLLIVQVPLMLLFYQRVRTDEEGIEHRGLLGRRRLRWDAIRTVRFKGGGVNNGFRQSDKIILSGDGGELIVTSDFRDFKALRERIGERLSAAGGPSLADAIAAFESKWWNILYIPHAEDFFETLLSVVAVGTALCVAVLLHGALPVGP